MLLQVVINVAVEALGDGQQPLSSAWTIRIMWSGPIAKTIGVNRMTCVCD